MTRSRMVTLLAAVLLAALVAWVAGNTVWRETTVPTLPKGEALTNPFYAVQRFAETLGARTAWKRVLVAPPTGAVIVLSAWHWDLSASRRDALERWVESGGRLVVDRTLAGGGHEFERWSGIVREYLEPDDPEASADAELQRCRGFQEERNGTPAGGSPESSRICGVDGRSSLTSDRRVSWALRDESGIQVMRVEVGRGRVTFINAVPFRERSLFDGDHGWLFTEATELRRGDEVIFLSEDVHPSLLALIWRYGAPVVTLTVAWIALVLWRGGVRFGPLAAVPDAARRSLIEQIRGTGQFALRHGGGAALHAASVRALDEAAEGRVPIYARLSPQERATALASVTGLDRDALAAAIHPTEKRRSHQLRHTIALLEVARRRTLIAHTRFTHGTG